MITLFEFHDDAEITDANRLKQFLQQLWNNEFMAKIKEENSLDQDDLNQDDKCQPFLSFDGGFIRANNYVGFIQLDSLHIEIYPKVFKNHPSCPKIMLTHLFFWFDYCKKWKFPFTKSRLDTTENIDLPELIIMLMASQMLEMVSTVPISLYQEVEEITSIPKGKINFKKYLATGFINGNQHLINCEYEPFLVDNKLNRSIKYVSRILLAKAKAAETQNVLHELIFILDDVTDEPSTYANVETIALNPIFEDYAQVKDICKTVLQQSLYGNQHYDLSQWSLLIPMEYIFEDFIAGFIGRHFSSIWTVEYQKSDMNLSSSPPAFQMRHDIFLTSKIDTSKSLIIDTKYKLRDSEFKKDKKRNISQPDMYQMLSYAFRRGCNKVLILYPNIDEEVQSADTFEIESKLSGKEKIYITAAEVPFWSLTNFDALKNSLSVVLTNLLNQYE